MDVEILINEAKGEGWWSRERKVGRHKRKLNGQDYVSPRVVLPPEYNHLIGRSFEIYTAKGKIVEEGWSGRKEKEGEMLILFFSESVREEESDFDEEFDGEWGDD